ncbi:hypothetical protein BD770DRAFT_393373 [Pilaira anomala]|nr:hypothetical protein BD770DRAFT_393373 [Pilaira anomala]
MEFPPRPDLNRDLYEKYMQNHDLEQYTLPVILRNNLDPTIATVTMCISNIKYCEHMLLNRYFFIVHNSSRKDIEV